MTRYSISADKVKAITFNGEEYEEVQVDTLYWLRELLMNGYTVSFKEEEYSTLSSTSTADFLNGSILYGETVYLSDDEFEKFSHLPVVEIEISTNGLGHTKDQLKEFKTLNFWKDFVEGDVLNKPTKWEVAPEDMVNQPNHYIGEHGLEVEKVLQNFMPRYNDSYISHRIASAVEYILRAPKKVGKQDIEKARKNLTQVLDYMEEFSIEDL